LQARRLDLGAGEQGVIGVKLTANNFTANKPPPQERAETGREKDSRQTRAASVKVKLAVTPLTEGGQEDVDAVPDLVELLVHLPHR
jgi:hypothetical protein